MIRKFEKAFRPVCLELKNNASIKALEKGLEEVN